MWEKLCLLVVFVVGIFFSLSLCRFYAQSAFGNIQFWFLRFFFCTVPLQHSFPLCSMPNIIVVVLFAVSLFFLFSTFIHCVLCAFSTQSKITKLLILRIFMLFRVFRCILHFALTHHHHKVLLFLSLFIIIIILYFGGKILLGIHFVCVVLQL